MNGFRTLINRDNRDDLFYENPKRRQLFANQEEFSHQTPDLPGLNLRFPASRSMLFKPPSLWYLW